MGGNLAEFTKVLLIVVTMSSVILSLRHFMTSLDFESEEEDSDPVDELNSRSSGG